MALPVLLTGANIVSAVAETWGDNGHEYEVIVTGGSITWNQAKTAAEGLTTCSGAVPGHLATAEDTGEDDFIKAFSNFPLSPAGPRLGPWIGGRQTSNIGTPTENWKWIVSESAILEQTTPSPGTSPFWHPIQPDDLVDFVENGNEDCLHYSTLLNSM